MRPLVEKNAGRGPAKKAGKPSGFEKLDVVLHRKSKEKLSTGEDEEVHETKGAKLETVVEEGVVKKIIVRCTCGEVIEIDCDYGT